MANDRQVAATSPWRALWISAVNSFHEGSPTTAYKAIKEAMMVVDHSADGITLKEAEILKSSILGKVQSYLNKIVLETESLPCKRAISCFQAFTLEALSYARELAGMTHLEAGVVSYLLVLEADLLLFMAIFSTTPEGSHSLRERADSLYQKAEKA